jgi:hypothetical protein
MDPVLWRLGAGRKPPPRALYYLSGAMLILQGAISQWMCDADVRADDAYSVGVRRYRKQASATQRDPPDVEANNAWVIGVAAEAVG